MEAVDVELPVVRSSPSPLQAPHILANTSLVNDSESPESAGIPLPSTPRDEGVMDGDVDSVVGATTGNGSCL